MLIAMTSLLCLASCGENVSDIVVKSSDMPRTNYVLGQELDLSLGKLTVITDGAESTIPMTADGVSVTGYDSNTLGKQTLTVTYKEKSTTFDVNVVARMVADGFKSEYFIDDKFDNSQGRLKITKDDGTTTTVNFNNEKVTFEGFNSSAAGTSTVTVKYDAGEGKVYETTFTTKIFAIGSVNFNKPSNTIYSSHDKQLSIGTGYFTVTAEGSDLFNYVEFTHDMYTGFKPWLATPAHRETPLEQTVVFTYAGQSFNFKVYIYYSGISLVKDAAAALKDVNVTSKDTVIDESLGTMALDAAMEYFKLDKAKKALIETEEIEKVISVASVYGMKMLFAESESYSDTFILDENSGDILINAVSYDTLKANMLKLKDSNEKFILYASLITDIKEEFADFVLYSETVEEETKDVKVSDLLKAPSEEQITFYVRLFDFMLTLSDTLSSVPDDWTEDSLATYKKDIEAAVKYITNSQYYGPTFNGVYNSISGFREKNDYFEIIYTYYLYVSEDTDKFFETILGTNGIKLPLPGDLQLWYTCISQGATELQKIGQYIESGSGYYETTIFMYYYTKVLEYSNSIATNENKLYRDIYDLLGGDKMVYDYLQHPQALGRLYHSVLVLDSEAYEALWNSYMALATRYYEKTIDVEADKEFFKAILDDMAKLTPTELYGFICSLNILYNVGGEDDRVFDYSQAAYSTLTYLFAHYEANEYKESEIRPIRQLFLAVETAALIGIRSTEVEFREEMKKVIDMFGAMTEDEKAKFNFVAEDLYNKYLVMYNSMNNTTEPDLGEVADSYAALKEVLKDFFKIQSFIADESIDATERSNFYILLFALGEKASQLYSDIVENGSPDAVNALYTIKYPFGENEFTLDYAFGYVRNSFYTNLAYKEVAYAVSPTQTMNISFWFLYDGSPALREFMGDISSILMSYYEKEELDGETIADIMLRFRNLTQTEQNLFYMFGNVLYYNMLLDFYTKDNEELADFVRAILQSEIAYGEYLKDPSDKGRVEFFTGENGMQNAISEYEEIEDKENLDQALKDLYNYYLAKYEKIMNPTLEI